jgi:hypothetical protein
MAKTAENRGRIMTTPENRLLPLSAIIAMLAVSSTIVGLAYWVGDAIGPGLASIVAVSTRPAAAPKPAGQAKSIATAPVLTKRADGDARR